MSGLFNQASLVLVPSGYKAGKVYSEVPTNGDGDLTFTRASSATRVNSDGEIEVVGSGVPRLDYSQGSCPALLLEPQRTNLLRYSEDFDNVYWGKQSGATVTANTTTSPDGTTNADTINLVSGSTISRVEKAGIAYTASTAYTLSFYFKNISLTSGQTFLMRFEGNGFDLRGTIDLANNTNTVSLTGTAVLGFVSGSERATLEEYGNGWVRCSIGLTTGTNSGNITVYLITNVDANRSFYAWGAQLEVGAYPTSYIPTTSATVTRLADSCSKTGISSLIGQTEGVLFFEWSKDVLNFGSAFSYFQVGTYPNYLGIYKQAANCICEVVNAGVVQAKITKSSVGIGTHKAAVAYANNDIAFYFDGVQVGTDSSATIPATSQIFLNANNGIAEKISQVVLFKTRLSNAELAELTTL